MEIVHLPFWNITSGSHNVSIIELIMQAYNSSEIRNDWRIEEPASEDDPQIDICHKQAILRQQGWKLHISAANASMESVLRCLLLVLLAEPTCFKVVASARWLSLLNQGLAGLSQIGKFITVYPIDDEQALRLAVKIDAATRGLRGPAVPSDHPLHPGSLVHYRYGSFLERLMITNEGTLVSGITTSTGELTEDRRTATYHVPAWVEDPFLEAGISETFSPLPTLLQGRYLPVASIHQSARGSIYESVDLKATRRCILKRAYHDGMLDVTLRDARDMLRHEAKILTRLKTVIPVPEVYSLFEQENDLWLAMEYIEGTVLEQYMHTLARTGSFLSIETLLRWARELATVLDQLHRQQIIYRDLKSINIIVAHDSSLQYIDFGLSHDRTLGECQFHGGTRGYSSPQQIENEPAAISDDIYSFGALLYLLATGAEPTLAPDSMLLERPLTLLNPRIPSVLSCLITRCLAPHPLHRYASMGKIISDLQAIGESLYTHEHFSNALQEIVSETEAHEEVQKRYYQYACELSETLTVVIRTAIQGDGPSWAQLKPSPQSRVILRDAGNGMAGVLLVLADIVERLHTPYLRVALRDGVSWLLRDNRLDGLLPPGFYNGGAGIGAALLRVGQVLEDSRLIAAAEKQGHIIAASPYDLHDLLISLIRLVRAMQ